MFKQSLTERPQSQQLGKVPLGKRMQVTKFPNKLTVQTEGTTELP